MWRNLVSLLEAKREFMMQGNVRNYSKHKSSVQTLFPYTFITFIDVFPPLFAASKFKGIFLVLG